MAVHFVMQKMAEEGLRSLLKTEPSNVRLDPKAQHPLSLTGQQAAGVPEPAGTRGAFEQVDWLSFRIPSGGTAQRPEGTIVLIPNDVPRGKVLQVVVASVLETPWNRTESAAWKMVAGQDSPGRALEFLSSVKTGQLDNGWSYRTQRAKIRKGGEAQVLILRPNNTGNPLLVLTMASHASTLERYLTRVTDLFTRERWR